MPTHTPRIDRPDEGWATGFTEMPLAVAGFDSYRYRGRYGWIMIGAIDHNDALREAGRSHAGGLTFSNLERWDGTRYAPVVPAGLEIRDQWGWYDWILRGADGGTVASSGPQNCRTESEALDHFLRTRGKAQPNAGARIFKHIKIIPAHDDGAGMLRAAMNSGMRHPQFELSAILPVILKR